MIDALTHSDKPRRFSYTFIYYGALSSRVIFNTMFFDKHIPFDKDGVAAIASSQLSMLGIESDDLNNRRADNDETGRGSDKEEIDNIVRWANQKVDFVLAPAPGTELAMWINPSNRFAEEVYRRFVESGEWQQIAGPITISQSERTVILHNTKRTIELLDHRAQ